MDVDDLKKLWGQFWREFTADGKPPREMTSEQQDQYFTMIGYMHVFVDWLEERKVVVR